MATDDVEQMTQSEPKEMQEEPQEETVATEFKEVADGSVPDDGPERFQQRPTTTHRKQNEGNIAIANI